MDLQAILDAPSSSTDDDDDYLQRYNTTTTTTNNGNNGNNNNNTAAIGESLVVDNNDHYALSLTDTVSNLSNDGGSSSSNKQERRTILLANNNGGGGESRQHLQQVNDDYHQQRHHHHGEEEEIIIPLSGYTPMDGTDILRDLQEEDRYHQTDETQEEEEEEDIVGQILKSYENNNNNTGGGGTTANLELERILREADANDDDDDDDDDDEEKSDYHHNLSPPRSSSNRSTTLNYMNRSTTTTTTNNNNNSTDMLLQSILNEADDDDDDDSDPLSPNYSGGSYYNNTMTHQKQQQQQQHVVESSLSGLSLSGLYKSTSSGSVEQKIRRLSSLTQQHQPTLHSMEVDAILNSVQDDDDSDDYDNDLDIRNYYSSTKKYHHHQQQQQHSQSLRSYGITTDSDDDNTDENNDHDVDDIRLNFNFSSSAIISSPHLLEKKKNNVKKKYDDNISMMQYPLTRNKEDNGEEIKKEIYIHHHHDDEKKKHHHELLDHSHNSNLKDYTANFLHDKQQHHHHVDVVVDDKNGQNEGDNSNTRNTIETTTNNNTDDDDNNEHHLSNLCLQHAAAYERKLLKPDKKNHRNVISPLTVKRRMKPRVELMTKSRIMSGGGGSLTTTTTTRHNSDQQQHQQQQQQQQPRFGFSGGIIQSKSMTVLGAQLLQRRRRRIGGGSSNKQQQHQSGLPTALAVNSKFIAVGNQSGQVWVFDLYEQLKIILGESNDGSMMDIAAITGGSTTSGGKSSSSSTPIISNTVGSVTSIDLSLHGGDFLLAGYGTGQIILWDIIKGSILKRITDLHMSSISSVRLTSTPNSSRMTGGGGGGGGLGSGGGIGGTGSDNEIGAVSVDAGGLVNKLVFSKGRLWSSTYSVETECLLDGTAGQILAMDALPPLDLASSSLLGSGGNGMMNKNKNNNHYHPSVHKIVLIALSSGRSSFAVSVEPKVSVLHRWARPSTERIDPTIGQDDRLTQVSSVASSAYYDNDDDDAAAPSTYVSSYGGTSYVSSYVSTSTYLSNSTMEPSPPKPPKPLDVNSTPVPYLPCLSWGWALVSGGGHSVTPILARAWGCCLQFLRASYPERDDDDENNANDDAADEIHWPAFGTHDEFDACAPVVALNWLGKRSLVYLTLTNEFTIIDTVIMTMQERLDFSGMKLVYAEFALSRSRQRQQPDSNARMTFMNSIRCSDNRLLVLCQDEIKEITVLGMREQIISLEDGGQWLEALALALDHYESTLDRRRGNASASSSSSLKHLDAMMMTSSSANPSLLLTEDEIWMAELLMRYLILAIDNAPVESSSPMEFSFSNSKLPNRLNLAESHFEMLSGVCLEFCIVTRRLDLLFGPIFRCFYEARYINVFLDVMETYVLNDKLKYIAPEAMVLFVAHCKDMKDLSMVERCLLHMDCSLMDYHSILSLLKRNALYTGLFHVFSTGLDDYISPLEILFEAVFDSADAAEDLYVDRRKDGFPRNNFERYGYKAILYLQHCFNGKTFPKGNEILPEERVQTLQPELFELLFREISNSPQQQRTEQQRRNSSFRGVRGLSYPYLRALILVDTKAFLDCLAIVLDDPRARFAETPNQMHPLGSWEVEYESDEMVRKFGSPEGGKNDLQLLPDRQHLVNILSSIIMSDSMIDSSYHLGSRKQLTLLSIKAKHFFLDFLANYLKLGVITAPKYLTGEVFIRLCNKRGASEDDILSLLHALPRSSYELDEVLYTVERVQMTRGALFLHKAGVTMSIDRDGLLEKCQHHFNRAIDCYLKDDDEDFKKGIFAYARKECSGRNVSMLRNVVLQRLPELVKLDAVHTAHLIGEIFVEEIDMILSSLKGIESGRVEYAFLHAIISGNLDKVDMVAAQELSANLTVDHHHSYLLLMTKFQPDIVYRYLSTNRNYRLDDALKLCQERKITDASAYLLERLGDVSGALKLMLETLDTRMITLKNILDHSVSANLSLRKGRRPADPKSSVYQNETAEKEVVRIKQILSAVLDLCERNKNDHLTLDNERGPLLWFHVLDRLVNTKSLLRMSKDSTMESTSIAMSAVLSELLLLTMQRMISNVSLYELMHKITRDHAGSDLGEFREMLVSMLMTYSSELDVCSTALDVMYYDIRTMSYDKKSLKVRGTLVHECPKLISKNSFLDVGPAGICDVSSRGHAHRNNAHKLSADEKSSAHNAVSLLQQRRRSERHQARRTGKRIRRGGKIINLMTASEYPGSVGGAHGIRQVGGLSEAQHVGRLF